MTIITKSDCPIANPEIKFEEEEDGALLFNPENGEVQLLNTTGTFLYRLLDGNHSRQDLIDSMMRQFESGNREAIEKDVDEFLTMLKSKRLVGEVV